MKKSYRLTSLEKTSLMSTQAQNSHFIGLNEKKNGVVEKSLEG